MSTPQNIELYWQDIEHIAKELGPNAKFRVGEVTYDTLKEFKKKYYGRNIRFLRIEDNTPEYPKYVEFTDYGLVHIHLKDNIKELEIANFLYSKQPNVEKFFEKILAFLTSFLIFSATAILLATKFLIQNEAIMNILYAIGILAFVIGWLLLFVPILFRRTYTGNKIICRTSDDKLHFWETNTFKQVSIAVIGGVVLLILQFILKIFGINIP